MRTVSGSLCSFTHGPKSTAKTVEITKGKMLAYTRETCVRGGESEQPSNKIMIMRTDW